MKNLLKWFAIVFFISEELAATSDSKINGICDVSGEMCNSENKDWNSLINWVNRQPVFVKQDEERTEKLLEKKINQHTRVKHLRDRFYQVTSQSLQTVCTVGKHIGGQWLTDCGHLDGQKYVCFDKLYFDIQNNECLVYSFGIGNDWSFEESMAGLGCQVRAFDPTVDPSRNPDTKNIRFYSLGLSSVSGNQIISDSTRARMTKLPAYTLNELIDMAGDQNRKISYLKVDIEGSEIDAISQWINSGIIDQVDQIGVEFHTGNTFLKESEISDKIFVLLEALRQLHKIGFRLISNHANNCVGKKQDDENKYYTLFDVVLYKP